MTVLGAPARGTTEPTVDGFRFAENFAARQPPGGDHDDHPTRS
jgi:hypothetical protein